ncbi:MAG TPA: hypothetical protein VD864_10060 [Nocardioides sp.]|nr:hypothetical protein [Nocardioides sp.]
MAGDFSERMDALMDMVGDGELEGSVVVDQVYALAQHERMDYRHPNGGQAKYLSGPLLENVRQYIGRLADAALLGGLSGAMTANVEDLSKEVFNKAPRDFWDLRESAHPRVVNDGEPVYDRAPTVHRLSPGALKVKSRLKSQGLGGGAS